MMAARALSRSGKSALKHRKRREWGARAALAIGIMVIGFFAAKNSLARVVARADPKRAFAMAPEDGEIAASYSQLAFTEAPSTDPTSFPSTLARNALLLEPTAIDALDVLGLQAQLRDRLIQSDRIFAYSEVLSRRNLRTRLWAIEDSVSRGDVAGAIRNYDLALRTSNEASKLLYPTLVAALSEPRIRAELLQIFATGPVWESSFVNYAVGSGIDPEGTIAFLQEGSRIGLKVDDSLRAKLVNALVSHNRPNKAWAYYLDFHPDASRDQSRDPMFTVQEDTRSVFDWRVGADKSLGAAILSEGDHGVVDFVAPPSVGGVVVSQMQSLPVGTYRLEGRSHNIKQPVRSQPYWALTCLGGKELGRVPVTNSEIGSGHFGGSFTVPEGCSVQTLSLVVRPSDDIMGVSGQIDMAQLLPASLDTSR